MANELDEYDQVAPTQPAPTRQDVRPQESLTGLPDVDYIIQLLNTASALLGDGKTDEAMQVMEEAKKRIYDYGLELHRDIIHLFAANYEKLCKIAASPGRPF